MRSLLSRHNGIFAALLALLIAAGYGVFRTRPEPVAAPTTRRAAGDGTVTVDQSSLNTVEALLRLPTTAEERSSAQRALRLADQEIDLAFAQAIRQAAMRPRAETPEVKQLDARMQSAKQALAADKARVDSLSAVGAKTKRADAQQIADRLEFAKAMAALDQDEVEDAEQDLARAGAYPQARVQAMIQQHDAATKSYDSLHVVVTAAADMPGLLHRVSTWQALHDKERQLAHAKTQADSIADALKARHDRLEAGGGQRLRDASARGVTHDSATALLLAAQRQALVSKSLATLDERVDNQHDLSDVYGSWITIVDRQERSAVNRMLRGVMALLVIVLVAVLVGRWADHILARASVDRRRAQTLHMVTRVVLQVLAALCILLVIFGPPNNLGTFLGLAGAGLTVALGDFIVGFFGWFALMGRDGIRIGDLVEINGVTGEVVELGMFHTVLLETGGGSSSGHPTGRRVTFSNSFAIQGHYFNFSTSGQWLWDEIEIVIPDGRDPYPVAESLRTEVEEATAETARQAEAEWKGSRRSPQFATLTAVPSVNLRPVPGGVEVGVRYVTRMRERAEVRDRLYGVAMQLLGAGAKAT